MIDDFDEQRRVARLLQDRIRCPARDAHARLRIYRHDADHVRIEQFLQAARIPRRDRRLNTSAQLAREWRAKEVERLISERTAA